MSSCRKVGAIDGGAENTPPNLLSPKKNDSTVTARMPIKIAPGTFSRSSDTIRKKPIADSTTGGECRSPNVT